MISSLNVWQNSPVNPSGHHAFCFRNLIVDSIFYRCKLIQIVHFFSFEFLQIVSFKELVHFIEVTKNVGLNCSQYFLTIHLMSMGPIGMSLVLFVKLISSVFLSPIFFISLTGGLYILLMFSRNQLLLSLIFLYYLHVFNFINFCSNFYYFFSLVTLDIICLVFQVFSHGNLDN